VIRGGSNTYIPKLTDGLQGAIHLKTPVQKVSRFEDCVVLHSHRGAEEFDGVLFGCHSDQALRMIEQPSPEESDILGAIPYQKNLATLHTDESVLPRRRLARAAWNYHLNGSIEKRACLTYNMNILQNLSCKKSYNVSLNYPDIAPDKIICQMTYHHPVFTLEGIAAQKRHGEISGRKRSFFAGAYWRFGFHEDGVTSGFRAAEQVRKLL
jgi:predicted NAD/FAD-binding protein